MPGTPSGENHSSENPDVGSELDPSTLQLRVELLHLGPDQAVLDLQMQLAEAQLHQVLFIQRLPSRLARSGAAQGLAWLSVHRPTMALQ